MSQLTRAPTVSAGQAAQLPDGRTFRPPAFDGQFLARRNGPPTGSDSCRARARPLRDAPRDPRDILLPMNRQPEWSPAKWRREVQMEQGPLASVDRQELLRTVTAVVTAAAAPAVTTGVAQAQSIVSCLPLRLSPRRRRQSTLSSPLRARAWSKQRRVRFGARPITASTRSVVCRTAPQLGGQEDSFPPRRRFAGRECAVRSASVRSVRKVTEGTQPRGITRRRLTRIGFSCTGSRSGRPRTVSVCTCGRRKSTVPGSVP
jgi:hypothetical protein